MMAKLRSLGHLSASLSGLVACTLLGGCIENPNSLGSEATAKGGASASATSPASGGATATLGTGGTTSAPSTGMITASATQDVIQSDLAHDTTPDVDGTQYQSFIGEANDLGLELFRLKAASESNVVYSPVSLHVALSMAYAGARNNTATQMKAVLGDPFGDETYHRAVNRLITQLRSRNLAATSPERPQSVELSLVDTWYLQRDYPVYQAYIDLLGTQYDAGVRLADFIGDLSGARDLINRFASDATKGKITDLVREGDITDLTRAVLVNALHFNATWKDPFAVASTSAADFDTGSGETVSASTMHSTQMFDYHQGSNYQAIRLPYIGGALSMLVVLPSEGQFASVRTGLSSAWIGGVNAALTELKVSLSLPKFRFVWGTEEFNQDLKALGMPDAFQSGIADFSGVTPRAGADSLYIFKVMQKAFIGVDEAGTEAAAVSAVVLNTKSMSDASMNVNRPFLFSIVDASGVVLFVGQVMDPR